MTKTTTTTIRRSLWTLISCLLQLLACCVAPNDDTGAYTRHDRAAYLAAGGTEVNYGGQWAPSIKKRVLGEAHGGGGDEAQRHRDDNADRCTTYLAPSSIADSGLGMYTAVPYRRGDAFPFPEIGILLQDRHHHYKYSKRKETTTLLSQYPWAAETLTLGGCEVGYGESLVPGLGMLANSHLGLVNMRQDLSWSAQPSRDGTDALFRPNSLTTADAGRGAQSPHRVTFEAHVPILAGEELFVSYGEDFFVSREDLLGPVPTKDHFREADELLRGWALLDARNVTMPYNALLEHAAGRDPRLRAALPDAAADAPLAVAWGTARFSVGNATRPLAWLARHGACVDGLVAGASTVPQAGRGAFATRAVGAGSPITTTPLVTLEREELHLWEEFERTAEGGAVMELVGHQLMLNYCYGHRDSSLLFFPYAPSVNFINHGSAEASNVELRWSTLPYHKAEWLNKTLDEMKDTIKTGLLLDVVATKDIRRGEEILLNYGKEWDSGWNEHIQEWESMDEPRNLTERLGLPLVTDLNQIDRHPTVRVKGEQAHDPYPPYVMTRCYFEPPELCTDGAGTLAVPLGSAGDVAALTARDTVYHCRSRWRLTFDPRQLHPCTLLSRESVEGRDWYVAQVEVPAPSEKRGESPTLHRVEYMTREALRFVDRPYSLDQYARGVFRQEIGLPDSLLPSHWMDLNGAKMD